MRNVQKVIVGKDEAINLALVALFCRGHILIEDVPGIGKTTLGKALAASLGCSFKRIQFTPDLMPGDVLGVNYFNQEVLRVRVPRRPHIQPGHTRRRDQPGDAPHPIGPPRSHAGDPGHHRGRYHAPAGTLPRHRHPEPRRAREGTFPLPEAQLDRFMVRVLIGYPTPHEEGEIYLRFERETALPSLEAVADAEGRAESPDHPARRSR